MCVCVCAGEYVSVYFSFRKCDERYILYDKFIYCIYQRVQSH